jgi:hypothetical protein
MDINRNQVFMVGLVLILFGVQFRFLDSVVLTAKTTRFLAEQTDQPGAAASKAIESIAGQQTAAPRKTLRPPDWLGFFLLSVGAVLILHSWTMAKPA